MAFSHTLSVNFKNKGVKMEIERKFLVKDISKINLKDYKNKQIIQDYLYNDKFTVVRKRKIIVDNISKYKYTIKTGKTSISVNEIEKDITEEEYNNLQTQEKNVQINKTRYIIPYKGNLKIELDVFHGVYEGIVFAEIEFESEEQAYNTILPDWFDEEISTTITNSDMAFNYEKSINILNNLIN